MKKIILSLIMLCTTVSAWSQTSYATQTITLNYDDCDESYKTTDSGTGIYVSAPKANAVDGKIVEKSQMLTSSFWKLK